MIRPIGFNAWLKKDKKIIKVEVINFNSGVITCIDNIDAAKEEQIWLIEKFEDIFLLQYTGLKDSRGKKIFEGDIVESLNHYKNPPTLDVGEIIYQEEYARFALKSHEWDLPFAIGSSEEGFSKIKLKVIGNRFEFYERLKEN